MPFVIDDIALAATEAAVEAAVEAGAEAVEASAETAAETVSSGPEILGDGLSEEAISEKGIVEPTEKPNTLFDSDSDIIGDGLGENSLENNVPEMSSTIDAVSDSNSDIIGDGVGDISLEKSFPDLLSFIDIFTDSNGGEALGNFNQDILGPSDLADDYGSQYIKDSTLLPDNCYVLNDYIYNTDSQGRIISCEGELKIPETKTERPTLPETPDRLSTDDRGHLIAREFGGADTKGNLVSMNAELNRNGDYRNWEREGSNAVKSGQFVSVHIELNYDEISKRPSSFTVTMIIDSEINEKTFLNKIK